MLKLILVAVVVVVGACTGENKTDALACKTSNDCNNGRLCVGGYCVTSAMGFCPGECNSCSGANTCNIQVTSGGMDVACPAGFACNIMCSGAGACGDITCGPDRCSITCQGVGACGTIDCGTSCGCQVNCGSGACGAEMCPTGRMGAACVSGTNCSTGPTGCNGC